MTEFGKIILAIGLFIALLGALIWGLGKAGFHGLPGDIRYERENVRFYFPIVSSIVLSILVTVIVWLWRWWRG